MPAFPFQVLPMSAHMSLLLLPFEMAALVAVIILIAGVVYVAGRLTENDTVRRAGKYIAYVALVPAAIAILVLLFLLMPAILIGIRALLVGA